MSGAANPLHDGNVLLVIPRRRKVIAAAEALLDGMEPCHQAAEVVAGVAVERLPLKKAGQMGIFKLLPGIEQGGALQEIEHGSVVHQVVFLLNQGGDAGLVVVFQKTHLIVVVGIDCLLEVQQIQILAQPGLAPEIVVKDLPDVILILHVEGGIQRRVLGGIDALPSGPAAEAAVDALRQPDAARLDFFHCFPGLEPEFHRDKRGHVAAEAVHDLRPPAQALDLVIPQRPLAVVQVDHIGPVADLVAGPALRRFVKPLRVLTVEHGVRRGVVIYHVDDALHAPLMDLFHQAAEVLHGAVGRVHIPVVPVGVGAAQAALLALDADGVDGHEPDNVRAQGLDPVQIRNHREECPLLRVAADINGIDHLILQSGVGIGRHGHPSVLNRGFTARKPSSFPSRRYRYPRHIAGRQSPLSDRNLQHAGSFHIR